MTHNLQHALSIAREHGLEAAARYLQAEIESIEECNQICLYVNLGDTYTDTILAYDGEYHIGSWGAWLESVEAEYAAENDACRCGYCGEWTTTGEEWRKTRCVSCGRNVATGESMNIQREKEQE